MKTTAREYNYTIISFEDTKGPIKFSGTVKAKNSLSELTDSYDDTTGDLTFVGTPLMYKHATNNLRPLLLSDKEKFYEKTREEHFYTADKDGKFWWAKYVVWSPSIGRWKKSAIEDYILVSHYDNTFRDFNGAIIPCLRKFDYMTGFEEAHADYCVNWNIDKLFHRLKKCQYVLSCELKDVPYYNSSFPGQKQVEFTAYVPKEVEGSHEFNSWKNDGNYFDLKHDLLNIKDCVKSEPYIDKNDHEE